MTRPDYAKPWLLITSAIFALAADAAETANPAAVFCEQQGGSYRVAREAEGERGICVLPDGREVDAWTFFRGHSEASDRGLTPTAHTQQDSGESMTHYSRAGGWTRQDSVSDDAKMALDWVLGKMNTAAGLRGIREVWTQVVAGLNYAIEFELDNGELWHTVVYRDLDGKFHMTRAAQLGPLPAPSDRED